MSDKCNSVISTDYIVKVSVGLGLCLTLAGLAGCSAYAPSVGFATNDAPHGTRVDSTTMPAAWVGLLTDEDPIDKAAFDQAVGLVMNGQYQQASRQFSSLLTRLETALTAAKHRQPAANPAEASQQPTTAPVVGAARATVRMAGESMFWIAYCAEKQDQAGQAAILYNKVLANYPNTPAASQAAKRLNLLTGG